MVMSRGVQTVSAAGKALLITGAGGYLGSRLAAHYLETARQPLILWLHAANSDELDQKARALRETLGPLADGARVVGGETARGHIYQFNAFHNTLKLLFYGLISLVPGDRETPLYFVTADFAVDAVAAILEQGEREGIYHSCHTREESMTLGDLIDTAFLRFTLDTDFRERRILKPLFCDDATFRLLAEGIDSFGGDVVREGLGSIVPFAPQLFSHKSFDNRRLKETMHVYAAPDSLELVSNACDYLANTRWGRRLDNAT
jgi:nucleoside-diphosphate-sugar epimerase